MIRDRRDRPPGDAADELVGQGEALLEPGHGGDDAGRLDLGDRDVVDLGIRGFVARGERGDGEGESEELAHVVGSFQNLKAGGFSGVGR